MTVDPFAVLGLEPTATLAEVRAARRRLASEFHPDHGGDAIRMGEINVAFDAAVAHLTGRRTLPPPVPASPASPVSPRPAGFRGVQHDDPSFTVDALPAETFEALLVVTAWMGDVLVDDPPYLLEVHLFEPAPCWCRLELLPEAGGSSVTLTVASVGGQPAPDVEAVRDLYVANLNRL
jgi:hypothetical protein